MDIASLRQALALEQQARLQAQAEVQAARDALADGQRRELYFRHLTEHALDLITILDGDGTIRFESLSMKNELGWDPEECIGRNAFEFVHPEDVAHVGEAFAEALRTRGSTPLLSFRFLHKNGTYRVLEGRGNNLLNAPAVGGIVFNSRDVTETRRLEAQFNQSQKVQAIGQLTGGVAHDFNNILTAILGYTELALRQPASSCAGHLAEIRKAALRAAALTRQLLAFSRKQVLEPRVLSLHGVVLEMEPMLRRLLGGGVDMRIIAHDKVGNVRADLCQTEQVLLNLVVNARDAMAGVPGARLTIETANVVLDESYSAVRVDVAPGDYVMLAITDTGAGMSEEVQRHLFEPFFTTKETGKGTGLGLATCHGIVKQSGGHIAAYSEPGVGTTFRVYLPRVDQQSEPYRRAEEPAPASMTNATVLLVEDEPILRELGVAVLEELGFHVHTAGNGLEALALLREYRGAPIDLLLTDVIMPEMGGIELIKKWRLLSPRTRIICCSGYTEESILQTGGVESGIHFLQKPYSVSEVARKIHEALSGSFIAPARL